MTRGPSFKTDLCRKLRVVSAASGIVTALVGVGVMIGWFAGIEVLKRVVPPLVAMHPLTAIGLVLVGISLYLQARGTAFKGVARLLAALVLCMGMVKLLYLHAEWSFSFDKWVYRTVAGNPGFKYGGEMADSVALCFCLTGGALILLDWTTAKGRRAAEYLAVVVWLVAMLAVVGYVYEAKWLYGMTMRVPMALNSAIGFLVLSMGIAFARPDRGIMAVVTGDSPGGVMARRMLPAMVVVFVLAGGLRIAGQVHGLYSAELGVVLHAVNSIGIFGVFILWCARSLHHLHLEQRRVEEERERFFNLSLDLLCVAGTDGYFKKVNPAFTRTLGYSEVEMLSRPFIDFIHPDDLAATRSEVDILSTGAASVQFENRYRCKDGTWKWLSWNTQPFIEENILYAVARDVTEKKEAEFSILFLNEELTQQASRLEAVNKELESFSYSVSHDLRAPLRGIAGFAQALEEHAGDRLDETDRSYLQRVQRAAQRMGLLIDDLLKLSRLSRADMKFVEVDLAALACATVANLRAAEPDREVEIVIGPSIRVAGDPALLRVVLENLLENAWKFTSRSPGARIEFTGSPVPGGKVACTVRDNGAGFDMRYAHKLFGPFQRLHTQAEFPGSGIGLATVQRIIRRHGGDVTATGEINHGAAFEFTLEAVSERNRDEPEIHPAR